MRYNLLPIANNSNLTHGGCQLMLVVLNRALVPFGEIICHSLQTKTAGHGTKHKEPFVFPCLIHTLCCLKGVEPTPVMSGMRHLLFMT